MAAVKVAIIGGGNLGQSIAEGLLASGFCKGTDIWMTRRNLAAIQHWKSRGIHVTDSNKEAVKAASVVILAVKPFQVAEVLAGFKKELTAKHILISVVTGVSVTDINALIGKKLSVCRAMPNTAIAIRQSMTCLSFAESSEQQIKLVRALFETVGKVAVIDEKLMDAATVLGACGTAYAMRYIRANIQGGIEIGFDAATASLIAAQTVKGAAELLLEKGSHPEQEIDKVTTPKGCTIAGLNEMEHQGFSSSLIKGIAASFRKIQH
jgi:pyrroline-5-carboxylate reductase